MQLRRSLRKPRDFRDFPEVFVFFFMTLSDVLPAPEPHSRLCVLRELRVRYLLRPPAALTPPRDGFSASGAAA